MRARARRRAPPNHLPHLHWGLPTPPSKHVTHAYPSARSPRVMLVSPPLTARTARDNLASYPRRPSTSADQRPSASASACQPRRLPQTGYHEAFIDGNRLCIIMEAGPLPPAQPSSETTQLFPL